MECIGCGCLVWPYTAYLHCILGIGRPAVCEGGADERDDVISSGDDEVSNETFVAVDNKVSAELFGFFVVSYELGGGHVSNVTADGLGYFFLVSFFLSFA